MHQSLIQKSLEHSDLYPHALKIVKKLAQNGFTAYFAGGCVRDALLGRTFHDIDIATEAHPSVIAKLFPTHKMVGAHFGVVLVLVGSISFEVATFREDGAYSDGRHPDFVTFSSAKKDALRRDFTINGLFYDPLNHKILDYVNGVDDLKKRLLTPIGEAHKRFNEDKLRLLRYVRFYAQLLPYQFHLDESILPLIKEMAPTIKSVSLERIRQEVFHIFTFSIDKTPLDYLVKLNLAPFIFPIPLKQENVIFYEKLLQNNFSGELLLLSLFWDHPKPVTPLRKAFVLSNKESSYIQNLLLLLKAFLEVKMLPLYTLKKMFRLPRFSTLLKWLGIWVSTLRPRLSQDFTYFKELYKQKKDKLYPQPYIKGDILIKLGLKPSALFKKILDDIENAQLNEEIHTKEECFNYLETLLEQYNVEISEPN